MAKKLKFKRIDGHLRKVPGRGAKVRVRPHMRKVGKFVKAPKTKKKLKKIRMKGIEIRENIDDYFIDQQKALKRFGVD